MVYRAVAGLGAGFAVMRGTRLGLHTTVFRSISVKANETVQLRRHTEADPAWTSFEPPKNIRSMIVGAIDPRGPTDRRAQGVRPRAVRLRRAETRRYVCWPNC